MPNIIHIVALLLRRLQELLEAEYDRYFLWVPVCFGTGIYTYFSLPFEPTLPQALIIAIIGAGPYIAARGRHYSSVMLTAAAAVLWTGLGFANARIHTTITDTTTLAKKVRAASITGAIEHIEPRQPRGWRFVLDVEDIGRISSARTPQKIRITSMHDLSGLEIGSKISFRAALMPLPEPIEPHGADFARKMWFDGIGATGFTVSAPRIIAKGTGASEFIGQLRQQIDARINAAVPGKAGSFASAIIVGLRGGITTETTEALRRSGLAHLLAISGMHMSLITFSIFWLARALLATSSTLALAYPIKKWSAVAAIGGAGFYLLVSGTSIATQRAFIMLSIFFIAILFDRPALTIRNVALAAMVVLIISPANLLSVSFQMSFAAVVALLAVYERLRLHDIFNTTGIVGQIWLYIAGIAATTIIASIAIAPFAAFHFHQVAVYSLLANIAAMPVFTTLVMPMALLAVLVMPLGLEHWPLEVMALGIDMIVDIATEVSSRPGAVIHVTKFSPILLGTIIFGGLWLLLWRHRWRFAGVLPMLVAISLIPAGNNMPDILIHREGKYIGILNNGLLHVSTHSKRSNYTMDKWQKTYGLDDITRIGEVTSIFRCDRVGCIAHVKDKLISLAMHPAALADDCQKADVLIAGFYLGNKCKGPALVIDKKSLYTSGAHGIYIRDGKISKTTTRQERGHRPWHPAR
jgi:competence protein ComEC